MITHTTQYCKEELRNASLKATPARLAVLQLLEKKDKPLDAGTIKESLEREGIGVDPVTVFRTLNHFTQRGLIRQVQFHEDKTRYEPSARGDHHHLICESCGSVEDIADCEIHTQEEEIRRKKRFLVKNHSLEFFGICLKCQP